MQSKALPPHPPRWVDSRDIKTFHHHPSLPLLSGANHRSAQVLILLVVPGHVIFLYTIHLMKSGHTTLTPIFMSVYLATALLQVTFTDIVAPHVFNVETA